jgi:hypothetical protein
VSNSDWLFLTWRRREDLLEWASNGYEQESPSPASLLRNCWTTIDPPVNWKD